MTSHPNFLSWTVNKIFKWPPSLSGLWLYGAVFIILLAMVTAAPAFQNLVDSMLPNAHFSFIRDPYHVPSLVLIFALAGVFLEIVSKAYRVSYNRWIGTIGWFLALSMACLSIFPDQFASIGHPPVGYVAPIIRDFPKIDILSENYGWLCFFAIATFVALVIEALVKRRPLRDKPANPTLDAFE